MADKGEKDGGEGEKKAIPQRPKVLVKAVKTPSTSRTSQEPSPSTSSGHKLEKIEGKQESGKVGEKEEESTSSSSTLSTVKAQIIRRESTQSIQCHSPEGQWNDSLKIQICTIQEWRDSVVEDWKNSAVFHFFVVENDRTMRNHGHTFSYPLYNDHSLEIYKRHVRINKYYKMEYHNSRKIGPELYDWETQRHVNVALFNEILGSLSEEECTPQLPKEDEEIKVRIAALSTEPREVFLNLNRRIARLVEYVLRISALEKIRSDGIDELTALTALEEGKIYFHAKKIINTYQFTRVKLSDNAEEKIRQYRFKRNVQRAEEARRYENLPSWRLPRIWARQQQDVEVDYRSVMCRAIDLGPDIAYDIRYIHPITDISEELGRTAGQASTVQVVSLDTYEVNVEDLLVDLKTDSELLMARAAFPNLPGLENVLVLKTLNPRDRTMYRSYRFYHVPPHYDG